MEMPFPTNEHRRLEKLAGRFTARETVHPSNWSPETTSAQSTTEGRVALDGFAVIQDYEQRQEDGDVYRGHGVFRYDSPSDTYELHWFDSTGEPLNLFRGGFEGQMLTLTSRGGDGWLRLIYDFNLTDGYRLRMETSADGERWERIIEGDNLLSKKATAKKATAKKATAKKATAKKATAKKATAKKATAKKATAKKAGGKKATAKKAGGKKAAAKKRPAKKATARNAVPASEKRRRQKSTAEHSRSAARKTTRPVGASAGDGAGVSQQRSKGTAHKGPRMPRTHKTSTRVGWHKTAAKGTRTR